MWFGVKNGPPTYQKVVTKAFKEYLDNFMKIFLDDFTFIGLGKILMTWKVIYKNSDYVFKSVKNMTLI
jgi:hypothetical protein